MKGAVGNDGRTITVRIPMRLQRSRGRKVIVGPDGGQCAPARHHVDNALMKALARAHRWKRMIESGRFASLTELAEAEKIAPKARPDGVSVTEAAAWTSVARVLMNVDEFITRE